MLESLRWKSASGQNDWRPKWFDRYIFAIVNTWIYLAHPRFIQLFVKMMGRYPNIARPSGVNEFTQWRKLFDRNPDFRLFSDKLLSRQWAAQRCPGLKAPEVLWQGEQPSDIPDRYLTSECVIKTNHSSGQNYFPRKARLARREVEDKFARWLTESPAQTYSEWAYSCVAKKIFVEKLVHGAGPLMDISLRAHNGHISLASAAVDYKSDRQRIAYFWPDGSRCEAANQFIEQQYLLTSEIGLPTYFPKAMEYAKILSRGIDYIRVDFLSTGTELYFGEMTIYPASGYGREGPIGEIVFAAWIEHVRNGWFFRQKHNVFMALYRSALERHFFNLSQQMDVSAYRVA